MKTPTMHDVAALAGVSQATVSLVLNGHEHRVSEATRTRVIEAMEELDYRRNAAAKTLRDGTAGLVGFIGDVVASAPFAGRIIEGAQERAWADGMLMLALNTAGDPDVERAAIQSLRSHRVAGIVYAAMFHQRLKVPAEFEGVRAVMLNSTSDDDSLDAVVPDEFHGGFEATQCLIDAGHRGIGMINIEKRASGLPAAVERYEGYLAALRNAGIAPRDAWYREGDGNPELARQLALEILTAPDRPTAIFCANDRTAWGLYLAAAELGVRIPDDLSVVGFDNQETLAPFLRPALTTMALPFVEMGRRAVDRLLSPRTSDPIVERVHTPLVERHSVSGPAS
jgi:LacI family transcriptional regulator